MIDRKGSEQYTFSSFVGKNWREPILWKDYLWFSSFLGGKTCGEGKNVGWEENSVGWEVEDMGAHLVHEQMARGSPAGYWLYCLFF